LPAAVDDDKAGLNREGHTGNDHHRRARAVGVNLVCAGCLAVSSGAGGLSVCTVDVGEVAVTVVRADAGADERLSESRAGPANAADEKAVIASKRGVAARSRMSGNRGIPSEIGKLVLQRREASIHAPGHGPGVVVADHQSAHAAVPRELQIQRVARPRFEPATTRR
jgi:hypothetical protein